MKTISARDLYTHRGRFTLIDVRNPNEYSAAHIEGSQLMPLTQWHSAQLKAQLALDAPLVLICQGGMRACKAAELLAQSGYTDIAVLDGGINAWRQAGLPLETNAGNLQEAS